MEVMCQDELSGKRVSHEMSTTEVSAAELLHDVCALFGREELDSALEVDGAVVCTGVVGGVRGGEASVGSLGLHSGSSLVLLRSRDRVLEVVTEWGFYPSDTLPPWAWDDETVALAAIDCEFASVRRVSERLLESDSFMRNAVSQTCQLLGYASAEVQADREVVLAAVTADGRLLRYASNKLQGDKGVVLAAVAEDASALRHANEQMRATKDVVLAAVAQDGLVLRRASTELRNDKDVVLAAVTQDGDARRYASAALQADEDVIAAAFGELSESADE